MAPQKKKNTKFVRLARKHHVAVNVFKGEVYFHVRHNDRSNYVSLTYDDLKSLVRQFPTLKKRMQEVKEHEKDNAEDSPVPEVPIDVDISDDDDE